ncbi:MAG: nitroreductase family protein [Candidatus Omnitrophica bacterium]|jgi:nitroreductase|nr:nitroreductase family protein [Candidatus Omnitrophota bacterium]MDD5518894.1 nitroreductase family protein [Candidatus Omnitrophota bacterium]
MDTLDTLKTRRSIRAYQDKAIPKDALKEIIDVARFSPTARNVQPWEFIVITDSRLLHKIGALAENARFMAYAKACIAVFCSNTKYYLEDGCAATVNILHAAAALGIGSCWVAGDKKPYCSEVAALLSVPQELRLVSLVALGYPTDQSDFKLGFKRSLRRLIHWEKF